MIKLWPPFSRMKSRFPGIAFEILHSFTPICLSNLHSNLLPPDLLQPRGTPGCPWVCHTLILCACSSFLHLEYFPDFYWVPIESCSNITFTQTSSLAPSLALLAIFYVTISRHKSLLLSLYKFPCLPLPPTCRLPQEQHVDWGLWLWSQTAGLKSTSNTLYMGDFDFGQDNLSKSQCSHLHNKGNNTYLSRSFKELNKTLYIQHQAQYLSLTYSSISNDSYHKHYYSFLTPII